MSLIYNGIVEKFQDISSKWCVRVDLTNYTTFFRFTSNPSDAEVETLANIYIAEQGEE